jgi:hypothetical protein
MAKSGRKQADKYFYNYLAEKTHIYLFIRNFYRNEPKKYVVVVNDLFL